MKKYENFSEFKKDYNVARARISQLSQKKSVMKKEITTNELQLLIIKKTLDFGRKFVDAVRNAESHMESPKNARDLFID